MKGFKFYSKEQHLLLLLNRFILKLDDSGIRKSKIVKDSYLFCVGFFIKYYDSEVNPFLHGSNSILAMLTMALTNQDAQPFYNTGQIDRVLYYYKFIVEYIAWNPVEAGKIFDDEKIKYEKFVIAQQTKLSVDNTRRRGVR